MVTRLVSQPASLSHRFWQYLVRKGVKRSHGEDKEEEDKGETWHWRLHLDPRPESAHLGWNLIAFIQRALQETRRSHGGVGSKSDSNQIFNALAESLKLGFTSFTECNVEHMMVTSQLAVKEALQNSKSRSLWIKVVVSSKKCLVADFWLSHLRFGGFVQWFPS